MEDKPKRKTRTSPAAVKKWQAAHLKRYSLPVSLDSERDIIDRLEAQENKAGYIKSLIRADVKEDNIMRYPAHNSTMLDTGIRKIDIVSLFGKDAQAAGGSYAVFSSRLTRRADAITTEGDIWEDDKEFLAVGDIAGCIAYIAAQSAPEGGRILYDAQGKTIWADIKAEVAYLDALRPLCDDEETLGLKLNYAAVIKNGYAPHSPGYNPSKRPIV